MKLIATTSIFTTLTACAALLPLEVVGQTISVGVVAGGSLTSAIEDRTRPVLLVPGFTSPFSGYRFFSPSKDYVAGGMLEVHFNPNWSIEADGLFRELHMSFTAVMRDGSFNSYSRSPVVTWEFPVLAKYRLQHHLVNPFFEAGPSFRTAGNLNGSNPSHVGITAGLGVAMHWGGLQIAPVARYTRWATDARRAGPQTASNQIELLAEFSREAESNWRPLGSRVSVGIVLGTSLTRDLRSSTLAFEEIVPGQPNVPVSISNSPGPRKIIAGPTVELELAHGLSVEADALYRPISGISEQNFAGTRSHQTYSFVTWEFPVLAKYSFRMRWLDPFVALGPSFRRPQSLTGASPYGAVAGTGVTFETAHVKIAPSIRYTHWAADKPWVSGGAVRNQTEVVAGFSF